VSSPLRISGYKRVTRQLSVTGYTEASWDEKMTSSPFNFSSMVAHGWFPVSPGCPQRFFSVEMIQMFALLQTTGFLTPHSFIQSCLEESGVCSPLLFLLRLSRPLLGFNAKSPSRYNKKKSVLAKCIQCRSTRGSTGCTFRLMAALSLEVQASTLRRGCQDSHQFPRIGSRAPLVLRQSVSVLP
jgi:hypothetical protein